MNFTDYEWLRKRGPQMANILNDCIEAERSARLRPMHTMIVARRALENIYQERCGKYRIQFTELWAAIDAVRACLPLSPEVRDEIKEDSDYIRHKGNKDVHPKKNSKIKVHAATTDRIEEALIVLEKLYKVMSLLYGEPRGKSFRRNRVPFDEYEIDRMILDPTAPTMTRYFVRGSNGRTYFLQSLSNKEMAEFEKRRQAANKLVYENRRRYSDRLLLPMNISLPDESDRKLLLYEAYPESFLLCEQKELKKTMKLKDALKLGLDLLEALEKLKRLDMHHRSIYPGCIMVESGENGGYEAYLMDLHTSKIINSNVTVVAKLMSAYDSSLYVPACLQGRPLDNVDWEKVDVFAVCRVVLFCIDSTLVPCTSTGVFRDHAELKNAPGMRTIYNRILLPDPKLRNIPTMKELKELFQNEYDHCK